MHKAVKTILILVLCTFMATLVWIANGFLGNPVSAILARSALKQYMEQTYSHLDLQTERFGFDFKSGGYFAYVVSKSSRDTAFYIDMDMLGHVTYDSFDTWVTSKMNTEHRVEEQYRQLVKSVLDSSGFPYLSDIKGGTLEFAQDWEWGDKRDHSYAIPRDELVMDKEYSLREIRDLGARAGILTIYVQENTVTAERAAEIMLHIKELFDAQDVPFYRMDFVLQYPKPEDDSPWPEGDVRAELVYDDIYEDGLTERIQNSHEAIYERFAEMDKEKGNLYSSND